MDIGQLTDTISNIYSEIISMHTGSIDKALLPDDVKDKLLYIKHSIEQIANIKGNGISAPASLKANVTHYENDRELLDLCHEKILAATHELMEIDNNTPNFTVRTKLSEIMSYIEGVAWVGDDRTIIEFKPFQTKYNMPWLNACLSYLYTKTAIFEEMCFDKKEAPKMNKDVKEFYKIFYENFKATPQETFYSFDTVPISSFLYEVYVYVNNLLAKLIEDEFEAISASSFIPLLSFFHRKCFVSYVNKCILRLPIFASIPYVEGIAISSPEIKGSFEQFIVGGCTCYAALSDNTIYMDTRPFETSGKTAIWPAIEQGKSILCYEQSFFLPTDWLKYYLPTNAKEFIVSIETEIQKQQLRLLKKSINIKDNNKN